ncbi:MAG: hypothetical protein GY761_08405 [Hyphomicrobiales bacterium]|nr:hypothetical protein [Hyphomicrobiales bacterium]
MIRIISTFLILSLVVIHGQINQAMFIADKTTSQISETVSSGVQDNSEVHASSERD